MPTEHRRIKNGPIMITIGDRLRSIRGVLDLTQEEMAIRVGLGAASWKRLELENRAPKGEVLTQLIDMGFSADWLLTGAGEMVAYPPGAKPPIPLNHPIDYSTRVMEIYLALHNDEQQPNAEINMELQRLARDETLSEYERNAADMLLAVFFKDPEADRRRNQNLAGVSARMKGANHLLNTALEAIAWEPSELIWHVVQSLVFKYAIEIEDIIRLLQAIRPKEERSGLPAINNQPSTDGDRKRQ